MVKYKFLANQANEFCGMFYKDISDLLIGQINEIIIERYLVYPTYFKWLFDSACTNTTTDSMYTTHAGHLIDFAPGSSMWPYVESQKILARKRKLEIHRIVVLSKSDLILGIAEVKKILKGLVSDKMILFLTTEEKIRERGYPRYMNWAIYKKDEATLLLEYDDLRDVFCGENLKRCATAISANHEDVERKLRTFNDITTDVTGQLILRLEWENDDEELENNLEQFLVSLFRDR